MITVLDRINDIQNIALGKEAILSDNVPLQPITLKENKTRLELNLEPLFNSNKALNKLQAEADVNRKERELFTKVVREQQQNISKSELLVSDLLKGSNRGDNIYSLLLEAVEIITLLTGNTALLEQIKRNLLEIYHIGLNEEGANEPFKADARERINKLKKAIDTETDKDIKKRLQDALKRNLELVEGK